jgi:hypothetical protein
MTPKPGEVYLVDLGMAGIKAAIRWALVTPREGKQAPTRRLPMPDNSIALRLEQKPDR